MPERIGVGIDVVEVSRFARAVAHRPRLLERIFTPRELQTCRSSHNADERLAARFAAKEAAFKALGSGWPEIRYGDVEVETSGAGAPTLHLQCRALTLAGQRECAVSLAHSGGIAIAEVLLWPSTRRT